MAVQQAEDDLSHPRELVRPCLLLLVAETPGHGYDLMARMKQFGFDWGGPGPVYRELRVLENGGLIASSWTEGDAGPARRVYSLTPEGVATLNRWADRLHDLRSVLDDYTTRFHSVAEGVRERVEPTESELEPAPAAPTPATAAATSGTGATAAERPDAGADGGAAERRRRASGRGLFRRR